MIASREILQCGAPYRGHPTNFFLQVSHKIQNDMFSIIPDWLTCIKGLLGGHGKARCTVTVLRKIVLKRGAN